MTRGHKKKKSPFKQSSLEYLQTYNVGHSWLSRNEQAETLPSYNATDDAFVGVAENRLVEMPILSAAISSFCLCKNCGEGNVELMESTSERQGLVSVCFLKCSACACKYDFPLSSRQSGKHPYATNVRATLGMRLVGAGHKALSTFAAALDMPPPSNHHSLATLNGRILEAVEKLARVSVREAAADLRSSVLGAEVDESSVANVTVSFDGSWSTRGFTARYGFSSVISVENKKVLDWHTGSRDCHRCQHIERTVANRESKEYQKLMEKHDAVCQRNHAGSAKSMEPDGAEILWERSVRKNKLRYTTFVGDGDSSSFGRVAALKPYGPDHPVIKEDCVGHVQKRMGTGLRDILKTNKGKKLGDGKGISGRNRLTKKRIDSLQNYYGKAVRNNIGDVQSARNAVLAILDHSASTDEHPMHARCPKGKESWCGYQRAMACRKPYQHKNPLPEAIRAAIEPLFERLASTSLLEKCSLGLTQNLNEALHSFIWQFAPKHLYHSPSDIYIASALAIGVFNEGMVFIEKVLKELGLSVSEHAGKSLQQKDTHRQKRSEQRATVEWKEKRKRKRKRQLGFEDAAERREGPTYEPGCFGPDGELMNLPTEIDAMEPPAKKVRVCRSCQQPRKGHQRGKGCPPY